MTSTLSPENTLSETDRGDDMRRRLRYQASYAAIVSLSLLDGTGSYIEVYCEHHEDVLVKKSDGKFIGIQVKTRAIGQNPFKADEDQIIHALRKFIELEILFQGYFSRFVIATNSGFWEGQRNGKNLPHLLESAKSVCDASSTPIGILKTYIKKLCGNRRNNAINGLPNDEVTRMSLISSVLCKTELQTDLPRFDDISLNLANQISSLPEADGRRWNELLNAANDLVDKMFRASSLDHNSAARHYIALGENPAQDIVRVTISNKRITAEIVRKIIQDALTTHVLLQNRNRVTLSELPQGMRRMELKMAAGGISVRNIDLMKDYKYSAELLLNEWIYRYGSHKAEEIYGHLSIIARTEHQEAYDSATTTEEIFGQRLLDGIRERLRNRHSRERNRLFGCDYEHLLGLIGILTEDCKVWWSEEFQIPNEAAQ